MIWLFGAILRAMKKYLIFKAGRGIYDIIREEGLKRDRVRAFAGPAGGPKWFVSVGFDKALIETGFLIRADRSRTLLAGSSAGAWRCLAMACKNPLDAYEKLRIAYSRNIFTAQDTAWSISAKLQQTVESFISDEDIGTIINNPKFRLAIHVVRSKGAAASSRRWVEGIALLSAGMMNVMSSKLMNLFYERVIFYTGKERPGFLLKTFDGSSHELMLGNVKQVALATGSLPYIIAGVKNIPGMEGEVFRDGGLLDYQLNQDYDPGEEGITLFFHYQDRITPGWFDKGLSWRKPADMVTDRVLQIYPGQDFVDMLPDKRIPDRDDFRTFVDNPSERIKRWDKVSDMSAILADYFFEAIESGKIKEMVSPIG